MQAETHQEIPTKMTRHLVSDFTSGVVVFLVALPLCLGVALASDAPLFSGLIAGIVGGLVVGALSGSHSSVSGPAAGLTAIVAAQIALLGSFEAFLLATVIAGLIQIAVGIARAGSIADFVPTSVIKGLLAAIGLILILKQIPHLFGHDPDPMGEMAFQQPDSETTFSELVQTFYNVQMGAAVVGLTCLVLLIAWDRIKLLKKIPVPSSLVVVLIGVGLAMFFERLGGRWFIDHTHLVQVPVAKTLGDFMGFLTLPDFTQIMNPTVYVAAITIAAVASLETLLNLEAVDKIDPYKRVSPPNRELLAQGVGNFTAGMIGGIPVTSVIIRSSVNINSGGKTKLATIIHGSLLLICVGLFPVWLNRIPLAALAAVLIVTGFKLASPKIFKQMWASGKTQFIPFAITVLAILLTDLLVGILIGLGVALLFILYSNVQRPLRRIHEKHIGGEVLHIELADQVSFLNRAALSRALHEVPEDGHVLIDARDTTYIDQDVLSLILEFETEVAPVRGIKVSHLGLKEHYEQLEDQVQYVDYATRELQSLLTPDQVLQILEEGNERFRRGQPLTRELDRQLTASANGMHPLAVVVGGTSSRTPVEIIFDMGVGDIFCCRTTGNFVSEGVIGSCEYATAIVGAKLIVVMGHKKNNVIRMAIEQYLGTSDTADMLECKFLQPILNEIQQSIDPECLRTWNELSEEEKEKCVDDLAAEHVRRSIQKIVESSSAIASLIEQGQVKIVGGIYDVYTGKVKFFDSAVSGGAPQSVGA